MGKTNVPTQPETTSIATEHCNKNSVTQLKLSQRNNFFGNKIGRGSIIVAEELIVKTTSSKPNTKTYELQSMPTQYRRYPRSAILPDGHSYAI